MASTCVRNWEGPLQALFQPPCLGPQGAQRAQVLINFTLQVSSGWGLQLAEKIAEGARILDFATVCEKGAGDHGIFTHRGCCVGLAEVVPRASIPIFLSQCPGRCVQPCRLPSAAQAYGTCSNFARQVLRSTVCSAMSLTKGCAGTRCIQQYGLPSAAQCTAQAHGAFSNAACQVLHRCTVHSAISLARCCAGARDTFSNVAFQVLDRRTVHAAIALAKCCTGTFSNVACQVLHRRTVQSALPIARCCTDARCTQQCRLPSAAHPHGALSIVAWQLAHMHTL